MPLATPSVFVHGVRQSAEWRTALAAAVILLLSMTTVALAQSGGQCKNQGNNPHECLDLEPPSGLPGTQVTLTATGLDGSATDVVLLETAVGGTSITTLASCTNDTQGNASCTFVAPSLPAGTYDVEIIEQSNDSTKDEAMSKAAVVPDRCQEHPQPQQPRDRQAHIGNKISTPNRYGAYARPITSKVSTRCGRDTPSSPTMTHTEVIHRSASRTNSRPPSTSASANRPRDAVKEQHHRLAEGHRGARQGQQDERIAQAVRGLLDGVEGRAIET
jgi:hypothetical protein